MGAISNEGSIDLHTTHARIAIACPTHRTTNEHTNKQINKQRYSQALALHKAICGAPTTGALRRLTHALVRAVTPSSKYSKLAAACLDGRLPCLLQNKLAGDVVLRRAQRLCVYFAGVYDSYEVCGGIAQNLHTVTPTSMMGKGGWKSDRLIDQVSII
jgi:hypothetical protein